jgi:hypothetical protein
MVPRAIRPASEIFVVKLRLSVAWGRVAGLWHDLGKYRPELLERFADR